MRRVAPLALNRERNGSSQRPLTCTFTSHFTTTSHHTKRQSFGNDHCIFFLVSATSIELHLQCNRRSSGTHPGSGRLDPRTSELLSLEISTKLDREHQLTVSERRGSDAELGRRNFVGKTLPAHTRLEDALYLVLKQANASPSSPLGCVWIHGWHVQTRKHQACVRFSRHRNQLP